jgi:uncharacterized membrane protein
MNKIILKTILTMAGLNFLFIPAISKADQLTNEPETFKARVIEVMEVKEMTREDGSKFKQQNLKLAGLEGKWKGKEIIYNGISDIEVADTGFYKTGDKVFVEGYIDESGEEVYYVVDFVRSGYIYLLTAIFVIIVLLAERLKGFKALLSLVISFVIIIKFILPEILAGRDPFIISLIGSLVILTVIIYLTEGFNKKSHLAVLSVLFSLFVTLILSVIFTNLTRLTGFSQEESAFLIGVGHVAINFKGLLLAGFIIGAVGVLDDIIVGQIEAVEQIKEANPYLPSGKVFILAYKVGNAHLGAIINTLFLTYVGASLPLLLLFVLNINGVTFDRLINTEVVSTEIVRTLVGSIGVILSMPIATFLASLKSKK